MATVGAAPHPYPLPVKNGERGIASVAASLLLPVTIRRSDGEKGNSRNLGALSATLAIGETIDDGVFLPVPIRGEMPGRAMRGGASLREARTTATSPTLFAPD
ncbi:MAG: hypothetical protein EOQ30_06815 [Mesorhizobium sp.]|nr:hypothetical protein EJ071_11220 [Mesorhizobium sp. M1B.F.Ca.ET.045.04.1.1]RWA64568.1 MAG: hypothetical protein EOQ29_28470 [Mesorhizobium sp.]RWA85386.1 MAG: hypothetical protein EOQ30_06815 [Mesorhizobium sp.]RWB23719.1 MAG: hypothetical protein EOQ40_01315 [Mesorhizobium sp.]RWD98069.1 MAG: hypothetical protein EOS40_25795 [Mesorhizobium sp.]